MTNSLFSKNTNCEMPTYPNFKYVKKTEKEDNYLLNAEALRNTHLLLSLTLPSDLQQVYSPELI